MRSDSLRTSHRQQGESQATDGATLADKLGDTAVTPRTCSQTAELAMTEYFLPQHVHFCCRGDSLVFLDLRADDYTLVSGDAASAIRMLCSHSQGSSAFAHDMSCLEDVLRGGLLTQDAHAGRRIRPAQIEFATRSVDDIAAAHLRLSPSRIGHFLGACTWALTALRFQPLERIVVRVQRRKALLAHMKSTDAPGACQLTSVFHRLRPCFPKSYLCLYDSLALLDFLARYRTFPTWVFGIKLEPWAAHCWVQDGHVVLNEDPEEAAGYTPVMAI